MNNAASMTGPEHAATKQRGSAAPATADKATLPRRQRQPTPRFDMPEIGSMLGRFCLETLLGEGGMGRVFEAWDPRLRRRVAIKTLRLREPEAVRRFVREGRLQASVSHPGICQVFEVGDEQVTPYLVMQRLHGQPLDKVAEDLLLEQKLVLIRKVAEAIHEAHRAGLIHRDLKPANIIVEAADAEVDPDPDTDPDPDPWRPIILDFGIARGVTEAQWTQAGELVGTPAYMAPEQIRGDADRRTDVYALGATLYRLLAGHPPFAGEDSAILVDVLESEPPSLDRQVPRDVASIVFKCLEKEPDRRYASARELAQDIDRYLDGRPISARPAGFWYRLQKRLRRQKVALRVAAVGALMLILALGWGGWTARQADRRERLARELTEQVEEIEALVRYSHLSPLHDTRPDRTLLRQRMERIRGAMQRAGRLGREPGHYALGRGYLALGDLEQAKNFLLLAWQGGFRDPEVGAALAQTLSGLYREHLSEVELGADWQARAHRVEQLQQTYGHPARTVLDQLAPPTASSALEPPSPESVLLEALALFHDDRFAAALAVLADASARRPWSYELPRLEGDIHRTWAVLHDSENNSEAAKQALTEALAAYQRAAAIGESDPGVYRAQAQTVFQLVSLEARSGTFSQSALDGALERLDKALVAQPDDGLAWLWKARMHRLAALGSRRQSIDPTTHLQAAIEATERAGETSAVAARAFGELGRAHWSWGQWLVDRGQDPSTQIDLAIAAFEHVDPAHRTYAYWTARGMAHATLGQHSVSQSKPARVHFNRAVDAYQAASRLHSAPFAAWINLGISMYKASGAEGVSDAKPLLRRALEALESAEALRPDHVAPPYYLGLCQLRLAQGGDPASGLLESARVDLAVESFQRALSIAPEMFQLHSALGETFYLRAVHTWERGAGDRGAGDRGEDAAELFARARSSYRRAAELAPQSPVPLINLAWTAYSEGKAQLRRGLDPQAALDEAARLAKDVIQRLDSPSARVCLGSTHRLRAEWRIHTQEGDPEPHFKQSEKIFLELLADHPKASEAYRSLGRLWTRRARWLAAAGEDPRPSFEQARQFLDQALGLAPNNAYFLMADARCHHAHADWLHRQRLVEARPITQARPIDARAALDQGLEAVLRARSLRPEWRQARELEDSLNALRRTLPEPPN